MSVIFGVRREAGATIREEDVLRLAIPTYRWAPDGTFAFAKGRIGMGNQLYYTHDRSRLESGPIQDERGNMLVLDGRLDNHIELRSLLGIADPEVSDGRIMLAAFHRWGVECCSRFVGDWALAIWSETDKALSLARDHAGTRSLYFEERSSELRWSTFLETLVAKQDSPALRKDYVDAYLGGDSIGDITPYVGVQSVSPGHVIVFHDGRRHQKPHWRCYPKGTIRYGHDKEYEEHFLDLLKQSVQRRTVPGAPVLAHLSGGMDSSTIVCISDLLKQETGNSHDLLDTVSFFDDSEPSWNERPYFTEVEAQRGKPGEHMDVSGLRPSFELDENETRTSLLPGLDPCIRTHAEEFERRIRDRGYRSLLSGFGGDELLGGVPTPLPELSDYLVRCQFAALWKRAIAWSLVPRKPVVYQLWETVRFSVNAYRGQPGNVHRPPWAISQSDHHHRDISNTPQGTAWEENWNTPTVITTANTWETLLTTLPNPQLTLGERREYRFPYLDRDLVDFLLQVPSEQLVRAGRRRSLMRRAVKGIVPEAVLERRRKGYLARSPMHTISVSTVRMRDVMATSHLVHQGYVDKDQFDAYLQRASLGVETRWAPALIRTCLLELWLRSHAYSLSH